MMTFRNLPVASYTAAFARQDRRVAEIRLAKVFRPAPSRLQRLIGALMGKPTPCALRRLVRTPSGAFRAVAIA